MFHLMRSFTERKLTALMIAICFIYIIGYIPQTLVMLLQSETTENMFGFQVRRKSLIQSIAHFPPTRRIFQYLRFTVMWPTVSRFSIIASTSTSSVWRAVTIHGHSS
jgi:hypothetical protein